MPFGDVSRPVNSGGMLSPDIPECKTEGPGRSSLKALLGALNRLPEATMKVAKLVLASVTLMLLLGAVYAHGGPDIKTSPIPAFSRSEDFGKGDHVEVEWQGEWWGALVIEARCDLYKVHYTGFDSSWDEWVEKPRMRRPGKTALRQPQADRGLRMHLRGPRQT